MYWPGAALGQSRGAALTLPQAISQALAQNPALQVFTQRLRGLEGERISADQAPAYEVGFEAENVLGSGPLRGTSGADYTLSLSSVIELGDQRQARTTVAQGRYGMQQAERRAQTLELLGGVTRAFITALALQEKLRLGGDAVALAEYTVNAVQRRVAEGASPEAEVLRARAQLGQSRLELARVRATYDTALAALASLLGQGQTSIEQVKGDLFSFDRPVNFNTLFERASTNPSIQVYASEERLRDAELALARSQSSGNIRWQLGARYFEEIDEAALVAGVSMPLFAADRNRGEETRARAARDEVRWRRESAMLELRSRLYAAFRNYQQAIAEANALRDNILPDLGSALELTRAAYEQGRYSYVEWQSTQWELLTAQRQRVDAAANALLNQALIEQLTAQPITAAVDE